MQQIPLDQLVGKTLGDYHIERLLGNGKSSAVYLARQLTGNATVIVTTCIIPETFSAQARERFMVRFMQEGQALVALRHPNIIPTYAIGEQFGYPYLVTSFVQGGSLAQLLKRQLRFTPERTIGLLKQLAAALDYAHSHGVIHGTLSPAQILVGGEQGLQGIQVAGFSLMRMLQMVGIERNDHPYPHLFSIAGTFLGTPEYIAPERVNGGPVDRRADIYSLGVILFELLSGTLPRRDPPQHVILSAAKDLAPPMSDPVEVALKCMQQPIPSLHRLYPDIPAAFDIVIQRALENDPTLRFQSAGEVTIAFERVLKVLSEAERPSVALSRDGVWDAEMTLPPNVNWFDEVMPSSAKIPSMQPGVTGQEPAGIPSASRSVFANIVDTVDSIDPFAWWSATVENMPASVPGRPATNVRIAGLGPAMKRRPTAVMKQRRQLLAILVAGGAMTALGVGGLALADVAESRSTQPAQATNVQSTSSTPDQAATSVPMSGQTSTPSQPSKPTSKSTQTSTPGSTPTTRSAPTPTPKPKPIPTPKPRPTPTPRHKGTIIGHTSMANNAASSFTNPSDGNASLLIHLADGSFVACERACTHAGVSVDYDSGSKTLVCPAHGAVFDPSNGFSPVSGPANGPLPGVTIHVNSDGTITVG